jgi:ribulose-phosphate 3-epimerase
MVLEFVKKVIKRPVDVHLMIVEPEKFTEEFKKAGADFLTVHIEACPNLHYNISQIKSLGMKAGVAINPHTPVSDLSEILHELHHVCMMSVNPGYGGQKFIPHTLEKIKQLRKMIDERGLKTLIQIDGGVTIENAPSIIQAGAHVLVAGNTVFRSSNPQKVISELKAI